MSDDAACDLGHERAWGGAHFPRAGSFDQPADDGRGVWPDHLCGGDDRGWRGGGRNARDERGVLGADTGRRGGTVAGMDGIP